MTPDDDRAMHGHRATIEIDLAAIDTDGLRGPPDGKVAVAYEFVIPDTAAARRRVLAIDPAVEFMPGSRGRIGAGRSARVRPMTSPGPHHGTLDTAAVLAGLRALRERQPVQFAAFYSSQLGGIGRA